MEKQTKLYIHISGLMYYARLQKGFSTLKEFYREKKPSIDYQSWLHIESGRRIPSPGTLITIGSILDIEREDLILAYCKDKFNDMVSHQAIESFKHKKFLSMDTLIQANDHDRSDDYIFTAEQVKEIQADPRLRLYLLYTYDHEQKSTISRLANFFGVSNNEARAVIDRLQSLNLVKVIEESVIKIHNHTTLPKTSDTLEVRKQLLLETLRLNLKTDSYITNYHLNITEKSYKNLLCLIDFIEATLIKMEKDDLKDLSSSRFQITITGSKISERSENDEV